MDRRKWNKEIFQKVNLLIMLACVFSMGVALLTPLECSPIALIALIISAFNLMMVTLVR